MAKDFIPNNDQDLLAWSGNFSTLITANPTSYGVTAAIATTLSTKKTAYATALSASTNPATRGGSTILAKDIARADLVGYCRQVARAIQGTLTVTNQQRYDLGLTVRDTQPSPIPPPAFAPDIDIVAVSGNTVRLRLHDTTTPARRGKPAGVAGASVFSHVGATAPTTESDWTFQGNVTRTSVDVVFPDTVAPGAKVWFTAFWFNPRGQKGPAATPATTNIAGGAAMAA